jgi:hypothetical protein
MRGHALFPACSGLRCADGGWPFIARPAAATARQRLREARLTALAAFTPADLRLRSGTTLPPKLLESMPSLAPERAAA